MICPVVVERLKPDGKAGKTAKDKVPDPPEAVTGVNGVMAAPVGAVVVATACVV